MAKRTVTYERPGSGLRPSRSSRRPDDYVPFDWDALRPVGPGEVRIVFMAGLVIGFFATLICYSKGYTLLYGDAVAHLAITGMQLNAELILLGNRIAKLIEDVLERDF